MSLRHLDDAELARRMHLELDPLTSSNSERELLERFEHRLDDRPRLALLDDANLDTVAELRPVVELHQEYGHMPLRELASVLLEHDIDTPEALRKTLERAARLTTAAENLAGSISTLQQALVAEE